MKKNNGTINRSKSVIHTMHQNGGCVLTSMNEEMKRNHSGGSQDPPSFYSFHFLIH